MLDLVGGIFLDAEFFQITFVHAGEDGDAEDEGGVGRFIGGGLGGAEHLGSAAGVDGEHLDIEPRGAGDGFGDGVGDVVKFEIEEHARAGVAHAADDVGAFGDEEFFADFECADGGGELFSERQCAGGVGHVQRGDDGILIIQRAEVSIRARG